VDSRIVFGISESKVAKYMELASITRRSFFCTLSFCRDRLYTNLLMVASVRWDTAGTDQATVMVCFEVRRLPA